LNNFIKNIDSAVSAQEMAYSVLQAMSTTLTDTRVHLTQIVSGTYGTGEEGQNARNRIAKEINDVLEQMVASANTRHVDQYLFAGENTATCPYAVQRSGGEIISVTYQGSYDPRNIDVAPGVQSDLTLAGSDIFSVGNRQIPVFYGSTGAAAGSGTSNVKGDLLLTVTHDGSNYKLSIDDGASEVTVPTVGDVSNIAVTNADGQVLYVDASALSAAGSERISVPGTHDIFNVLISTRDLLRNSKDLSDAALGDLIDVAAETIDEVKNSIVAKESVIGTRINFLDSLRTNLQNVNSNSEDETSMLEQADIAQIAIDISRRQALYEMSLSVVGKVMSMSILDFIQ